MKAYEVGTTDDGRKITCVVTEAFLGWNNLPGRIFGDYNFTERGSARVRYFGVLSSTRLHRVTRWKFLVDDRPIAENDIFCINGVQMKLVSHSVEEHYSDGDREPNGYYTLYTSLRPVDQNSAMGYIFLSVSETDGDGLWGIFALDGKFLEGDISLTDETREWLRQNP